jgi:hypothetical protein
MVGVNGAGRVLSIRCNPNPEETYFREKRADILYNEAGIPNVLVLRCRNKECCPPQEGKFSVHLFTLYGVQQDDEGNDVPIGRYFTRYIDFGSFGDFRLGARVANLSARSGH